MASSSTLGSWLRRGAWLLVGLLVLLIVAYQFLPQFLQSQVEQRASAALGRAVQVQSVEFKPWSLDLALNGLRIASADGKSDQLWVKRVQAQLSWSSLRYRAPVVNALTVIQPEVWLRYNGDGHYDIDDILARFNSEPKQPPGPTPAFALYNLALQQGSVHFADATVHATQTLSDIHLQLPFVSSFDAHREVQLRPQLDFRLNGSALALQGTTTPFASDRQSTLKLDIDHLDLAPYLPYWPSAVPLRLQKGVLQTHLSFDFAQEDKPRLHIRGTVALQGLHTAQAGTASSAYWLDLGAIGADIADLQPFAQSAHIHKLELQAPTVWVQRDAQGKINWQKLLAAANPPDKTPSAQQAVTSAPKSATTAAAPSANASASGWNLSLDQLTLNQGTVHWQDQTTAPTTELLLQPVSLQASAMHWPLREPVPLQASVGMAGAALNVTGSATTDAANVSVTLAKLPLSLGAAYLAPYINTQVVKPALGGQLEAAAQVHWQAPDKVQVSKGQATLSSFAVVPQQAVKGRMLASAQRLAVQGVELDLAKRALHIGQVALVKPEARVERDSHGQWMYTRWMHAQPPHAAAKVEAQNTSKIHAEPWNVAIENVAIEGGAVQLRDLAAPSPVSLDVSQLQLHASHVQPLAATAPASPVQLSAHIASRRQTPGTLDFKGQAGIAPLHVQGALKLVRLPLHAVEPYISDYLNVRVLQADASYQGQLDFAQTKAGPQLDVSGDTALENLRVMAVADSIAATAVAEATPTSAAKPAAPGAVVGKALSAGAGAGAVDSLIPGTGSQQATKAHASINQTTTLAVSEPSDEILNWKALSVHGLHLSMVPGRPLHLQTGPTQLSNFYARIALSDKGRLNVLDWLKHQPDASTAPVTSTTSLGTATAAAASSTSTAADPVMEFGPISVVNGTVRFSDHFIKPNYSADLSELEGQMGAFSSVSPQGSPQMADVQMSGKAQGSGSLNIVGKVNPLAKPLALDLTGKVRDLELAPLSPYSAKYVGYGIERGKLSVDVHYQVQPSGQLTANNSIVLNQLTFGDKAEGAETNLPVKLAVALLADSDGIIHLDLPISGSINDPQFSIGGLVFKMVVNLVVKAVTAPFSLLAHAFGGSGGEHMDAVPFDAGSAVLTPAAQARLDKVLEQLAKKPSLKLTVSGQAELGVEAGPWRRVQLAKQVQAQLGDKALPTAPSVPVGTASATASAALAPSGAAQQSADPAYLQALQALYRKASMDKPRTMLGLAKDQTPQQMEGLLMANMPVNQDTMRSLANQRAAVVRDYLLDHKLDANRLFLGEPALSGFDTAWTPQAKLGLQQ